MKKIVFTLALTAALLLAAVREAPGWRGRGDLASSTVPAGSGAVLR